MRPHEDRDLAYLWDMLDAAEAIHDFLQGKIFSEYLNNRMLRGAVERHLEIIGEAANRISSTLQVQSPEIPWRKIVAQRNVLAHEYGELKQELVWLVATAHIDRLIVDLRAIMTEIDSNSLNH